MWAPGTEALAVTDTHFGFQSVQSWKFWLGNTPANDVCVNVQNLMHAVERGNGGKGRERAFVPLFVLSLIWPFERESYEAYVGLDVANIKMALHL